MRELENYYNSINNGFERCHYDGPIDHIAEIILRFMDGIMGLIQPRYDPWGRWTGTCQLAEGQVDGNEYLEVLMNYDAEFGSHQLLFGAGHPTRPLLDSLVKNCAKLDPSVPAGLNRLSAIIDYEVLQRMLLRLGEKSEKEEWAELQPQGGGLMSFFSNALFSIFGGNEPQPGLQITSTLDYRSELVYRYYRARRRGNGYWRGTLILQCTHQGSTQTHVIPLSADFKFTVIFRQVNGSIVKQCYVGYCINFNSRYPDDEQLTSQTDRELVENGLMKIVLGRCFTAEQLDALKQSSALPDFDKFIRGATVFGQLPLNPGIWRGRSL